MLWIKTFKWGRKFDVDYVHKLAAGLRRHLDTPYQFELLTDDQSDLSGISHRPIRDPGICDGCFARLRLYDPEYQRELGIRAGERIIIIDLDVIITSSLSPLFNTSEPFKIITGANRSGRPYNGGLQMFQAGYRPDVWKDFTLDRRNYPNDEDWLHHKIPGVRGWPAGNASGVYAFLKPGWPDADETRRIDDLPDDARLVVFIGWRKPEKFKELSWMKQHWRM